MQIIKEGVQNLVVYMILITVILNLVKSSSYKKYIELFTGLVLILILFTPAARLFLEEGTFETYLEASQFKLETKDSAEFIYAAEENTKTELLKLYSDKITERIFELGDRNEIRVEKAEVSLSPAEEGFGTVEKIRVWIEETEKKREFKEILSEAFELSKGKITVK